MRIRRIRFKNLNSLAGVWDIDFTHPDYVSSGLFAITGPTGSGKSTILDAICLALYGQTPRLNRVTQGDNGIMSRQTGECSSEVEFETAKGRFRCHWSQHRARKLAGGPLQTPRHEIAEAESGLILESKLRNVIDKVEDVTGMDFDRFTRSMLLAQGGFAAFLQASPDERAPILEQITGTEIYSRISIKVHERTTEERRKLEGLRAEIAGLRFLTPEEEDSLRSAAAERQQERAGLATAGAGLAEALSWLERIAGLEAELLQLDQAWLHFEAKRELAAPDLERLALARQALPLGADQARISALRKQDCEDRAELSSAAEQLPLIRQGWQAAFDASEAAGVMLAGVRVAQAREAELIRRTRELDVKLRESHTQLAGLQAEIETQQRRNAASRLAITACDVRINQTRAALRDLEAQLAEQGPDAGLVESLAGIEQQVRALKLQDRLCRENREKQGRQTTLIESARLVLQRAEKDRLEALQAVGSAETRLGTLRQAQAELLQGRGVAQWRWEAEMLTERLSRLGPLQELLGRIGATREAIAGLEVRIGSLGLKKDELLLQEKNLAAESGLRQEVARQLQENVVLLNRVRDLEEQRSQLVDGVACPLCGALEHPYATGNIPSPDAAQQELERALSESKRVMEQLSMARVALAGISRDLEQGRQELAKTRQGLENDEAFFVAGLAELGIESGSAASPDSLMNESQACQQQLANRRSVVQKAEGNEQQERDLLATLTTTRAELGRLDQARLAADHGYSTAQGELLRLESEFVRLHDECDQALAEVERSIAPHGCGDIEIDSVDGLLIALVERRSGYLQRIQVRELLEKELAGMTGEKEKQQALLAEAERAQAERERQLAGRITKRDELAEQRLELYAERDPDKEERRLADALRQAGQQRDEALQEQNRLRGELNLLEQQTGRLTCSITGREGQLAELEAAFGRSLAAAGFADEDAFLPAVLPRERFQELEQLAEGLAREEGDIRIRQHDRGSALRVEQEKNLTDRPIDQIRDERTGVTRRLSELDGELGALGQKLNDHAQQQQHYQNRIQEIEKQKRECAPWEQLHLLIGSSDGKKFRNFAQGLTFELMVNHANRQLLKMSDRYILVRDSLDPLELNVIDNYQAGEIRSTRNLSGGESFIASLALSLGLSNMASANVRVDSLFLDEGFGTLDDDALESALETLAGLQQDGKLIGIISHVAALKERIGTQIQVASGSAGRSTLSGPGCCRIM